MLTRSRVNATLAGLMTALALGALTTSAQEPQADARNADARNAAARKAGDTARRVPDHFGKVGLTNEQRETIYKIRAKHGERIDALEQQIARLQAEMLAECEAVLSDSQKKQLASRREGAAKGKRAASAEAPKPAEGKKGQ